MSLCLCENKEIEQMFERIIEQWEQLERFHLGIDYYVFNNTFWREIEIYMKLLDSSQ